MLLPPSHAPTRGASESSAFSGIPATRHRLHKTPVCANFRLNAYSALGRRSFGDCGPGGPLLDAPGDSFQEYGSSARNSWPFDVAVLSGSRNCGLLERKPSDCLGEFMSAALSLARNRNLHRNVDLQHFTVLEINTFLLRIRTLMVIITIFLILLLLLMINLMAIHIHYLMMVLDTICIHYSSPRPRGALWMMIKSGSIVLWRARRHIEIDLY